MAKNNVFTNGMSTVTKKSGGKSIAFPDVCKTPTPGGPVPIPYPNIAQSSDLAKGSKTVKIEGASVCLKGSNFSSSTGNEAGTAGGGLASGKTKGIAEAINYSFNVKIEGRNVVRNLDLFLNNNKNTPPTPVLQSQGAQPVMAAIASEKAKKEKCPYCGKDEHHFAKKFGDNIGKSGVLSRNIISDIKKHDWYTGGFSLAAHHLICSEAMNNQDWSEYCKKFGYDINHKSNGVMLPMKISNACQLYIPLHRSNHNQGKAGNFSYPKAVINTIKEIKDSLASGEYCDDPNGLIEDLNDVSEYILGKVDKFEWTLTIYGRDYKQGGCGCSGVTSLPDKRKYPNKKCSVNRNHNLKNESNTLISNKKLRIGE